MRPSFPGRRRAVELALLHLSLLATLPWRAVAAQAGSADTLRLSVAEAIGLAQRQGDEIGIAEAQVNVADAVHGATRANMLPQLRLTGGYTRVFESARGQVVGAVFNQPNTYTVAANLSQVVFQGGKLVAATRAADESRQAARYDEREQRALLTLQVERAYLQALYAQRLADLQERNVALSAGRLAQVERFERAGQAARYDVLRARVERANLEPFAIQARSDRELAVIELKRLINVPADRPIALVSQVDADAAAALVAAVDDQVQVADRAAIRAAELTLEARRSGVAVARGDYFPAISIFLQSGYQAFPVAGQGLPTRFGSLTEDACPVGTVAGKACQNGGFFSDRQAGLTVSMPVFDGFRIKSNVDLATAQARIAELQLHHQRAAVALDAERSRAELRRARAVFSARRQNSAEADEAFRLATLRFERGLTTQLEVSDAQVALLTAQGTEARATYDLFLATADLARALGRPIPIPAAAAVPPAPTR